jgi:hypothetical protein
MATEIDGQQTSKDRIRQIVQKAIPVDEWLKKPLGNNHTQKTPQQLQRDT